MSPASSLSVTEVTLAANAKAPRVALADIQNAILSKQWITGKQLAGVGEGVGSPGRHMDVFTLCVLVMKNGFVVIGKSAPASPENFDPALGKQFAYEEAIRQLWPLMGYSLRDRLAGDTSKVAGVPVDDEERLARKRERNEEDVARGRKGEKAQARQLAKKKQAAAKRRK